MNNKGQTTVEYIFLLAAIALIMFSVLSRIRNSFVTDGSNCGATPLAPVCIFKSVLDPDANLSFRYFTIRR